MHIDGTRVLDSIYGEVCDLLPDKWWKLQNNIFVTLNRGRGESANELVLRVVGATCERSSQH